MNVERLLVMATARGISIDLGRPKSRDIPIEHRSRPRPRKEEGSKPIPGVLSAEGRQSRVGDRPFWSSTDLGHAAVGMDKVCWHSLCWCIGLEEVSRVFLKRELMAIADKRAKSEQWPKTIRRGECPVSGFSLSEDRYIEDLCTLALFEGAHPNMVRLESYRARYFGVSERNWGRVLTRHYQGLHSALMSWYGRAEGHLKAALREIDMSRSEGLAQRTA